METFFILEHLRRGFINVWSKDIFNKVIRHHYPLIFHTQRGSSTNSQFRRYYANNHVRHSKRWRYRQRWRKMGKGGWPGTVRSWWAGRGTSGGESVKEITPHSLKFHIYFLTFPHNDDKRLLVGCRRHFHEALQKRHSVFHVFFTLASQRVAGGVGGCC